MENVRDQIKGVEEGFVAEISTSIEIRGGFFSGSGIDGSVEQRMWNAARRGLLLLEDEMEKEAQTIINEFLGKQKN